MMITINTGNGHVNAHFLSSGDLYINENTIIPVLGTDPDGSIAVKMDNSLSYLVHNPYSNEYILTNSNKVPYLYVANHYEIVKCDKLKYIGFMIAKNGCSCLLKSALVYDEIMKNEDDRFIWEVVNEKGYRNQVVFNGERARQVLENYKDYKKFIVLQDEKERFMKYINWTHKNKYNTLLDLNLSKHDSLMEHIWAQKLFAKDRWVCDPHAISQDQYLHEFVRQYFDNDKEKFEKEVEIVALDNLKTWFEKQFGVPMIMNNIDSEEDKIYKLEDLTIEELKELEKVQKVCRSY